MRPAVCLAMLWAATRLAAQTPTVKLEDPAVIARGSAIFGATCGIGYCHGKEGRAGRGPRLAGRKLERDYLFRTVSDGVNNSLMPAFKGQLSADQIWSVVAYILTLSGGGPSVPSAAPAENAPEAKAPSKPADPSAGDPEAGRALFFDASSAKHCAGCHQYKGRGADVGPDLTGIAGKPPREILRDILEPDARLAIEPVAVKLKSGQRITGIRKQETRELIRIYDMAALPPVLRTIYKDQIESIQPDRHSPMPGDYGGVFSRKQLLDLVAFLKGAPVAPADVE